MTRDIDELFVQLRNSIVASNITNTYDLELASDIYDSYQDKTYGCYQVTKEFNSDFFFLFGYRNDIEQWMMGSNDYLGKTKDINLINVIRNHFPLIYLDSIYCPKCFLEKNAIGATESFRVLRMWKHTSNGVKHKLAEELMKHTQLRWRNVRSLFRQEPIIFFSSCGEHADSEDSEEIESVISIAYELFDKINSKELLECDEKYLELYISDFIEEIEEGLELIESQHQTENGIIDILAKDKNGTKCIIELKIKGNNKDIVFQSAYYPTQFIEPTRMITICPNYERKIYLALSRIGVEILTYRLDENGFFQIIPFEPNYNILLPSTSVQPDKLSLPMTT